MKPELLLSVDSKQSFWIDPRTKLYMLVIFSIVMIDGKTDGISFWLKPILALIPFFLLLSGRRKKIAIIYLIVFIVSWTVNVFLVPYDLSAAALTRGLGNGKKRTSICKIGFHWKDFALMIIVTAALLVFLLF